VSEWSYNLLLSVLNAEVQIITHQFILEKAELNTPFNMRYFYKSSKHEGALQKVINGWYQLPHLPLLLVLQASNFLRELAKAWVWWSNTQQVLSPLFELKSSSIHLHILLSIHRSLSHMEPRYAPGMQHRLSVILSQHAPCKMILMPWKRPLREAYHES
jgi:hypothetical protein